MKRLASCGGILELRRGSQASSWVGTGKPNLPLELRGKAGGCARVTAGPKRPHLGVCPGPKIPLQERQGSRGCIPGSPRESGPKIMSLLSCRAEAQMQDPGSKLDTCYGSLPRSPLAPGTGSHSQTETSDPGSICPQLCACCCPADSGDVAQTHKGVCDF